MKQNREIKTRWLNFLYVWMILECIAIPFGIFLELDISTLSPYPSHPYIIPPIVNVLILMGVLLQFVQFIINIVARVNRYKDFGYTAIVCSCWLRFIVLCIGIILSVMGTHSALLSTGDLVAFIDAEAIAVMIVLILVCSVLQALNIIYIKKRKCLYETSDYIKMNRYEPNASSVSTQG